MSDPGRFRLLVDKARLAATRTGAFLRTLGMPLPARARVVYHPDYVTPLRQAGARHAFDVRRSERILDELIRTGVLSPAEVLRPELATMEDLLRVHTAEYLEELEEPGKLADVLFVQRDLLRDNSLLQLFLRQAGGTMLAAERSVIDGVPVFNLGGGYHHAQRDRAEGFCAINDVAIAVRRLQHLGLAREVLVLDLDYHHGNGTALIFSKDESVFTLSVHGQSWARIRGKHNNLDLELPPNTEDELYLSTVRRGLERVLKRFLPQAAIYIAGADPHHADTFGDFRISDQGMLERDLTVLEMLREVDIPVSVVLGGGYSPFAWTVAYNFIFSVLNGAPIQPAYRPGNLRARFDRISGRLGRDELSQPRITPAPELCESEDEPCLFMGYYTMDGLKVALERYGMMDLLRERVSGSLLLSMNTTDPDRQLVRVHFDRRDPDHLLVELVTRFRTLVMPQAAVAEGIEETHRMVSIEWLLMQNPLGTFSLERERLPGQNYPGLGLSRWTLELLRIMAERLECSGLMNLPQHYHNAYLYSRQMLFLSPQDQGRFEALVRDVGSLPVIDATRAVDEHRVRDLRTGEVLVWEGTPQVMPIRPSLNAYFARPSYAEEVAAARERHRFQIENG